MTDVTKSYWMEVPPIVGKTETPRDGSIAVIGSGLTGASAAYWLTEYGFDDVTILDYESERAATYRNCGHILYGTVESMFALTALHGEKTAKEIWQFSIDICHEVRDTIRRLKIPADYRQDGYLVMAIDKVEEQEIHQSISLLNSMGFESTYMNQNQLSAFGFKNVFGGRFEPGSAQAHPVKFRNGLIQECLKRNVHYHSNIRVSEVEESNNGESVTIVSQKGKHKFDAVVIAANAYSPLLSRFFLEKRLIDPFKGQIIASKPLKNTIKCTIPHSFDHGYEYALASQDNRLIIGGWRNNTPGGEIGTYNILPNPTVETGLMRFVEDHYEIDEKIEWEYSWSGIMAASKTGFPYIGPTTSPRIFTCAGYTGHGFSWAHGSAKLLAQLMSGVETPDVAKYFNPKI
ncbi:MAG: FAD-dependent oxidoreductase [Proteobacteria bacterium]|nr:FAD-dependent oxidoreductase [Pseudomonadota bacterium]